MRQPLSLTQADHSDKSKCSELMILSDGLPSRLETNNASSAITAYNLTACDRLITSTSKKKIWIYLKMIEPYTVE